MSSKMKNKQYEFTILYFIAIIMMVSQHAHNGGVSLFYEWFNPTTIIIAIFAFSSGYFFVKNEEKPAGSIIVNKIKKLIIPLYVWNLIYGIVVFLLKQNNIISFGGNLNFENLFLSPIYSGHQFLFNLGSWFIIPLFMMHIFSIIFIPILKKRNGPWFVFFVYLWIGMLGIQLSILGYKFDWWIVLSRFTYCLPFFGLGILYNKKIERHDTVSNGIYFAIVIALQLLLICCNCGLREYYPAWAENFDNFFGPFIWGFTGIAFWFRISKILIPILKNSKIVNVISENTFSIMMHHLFGFFLLNLYLSFINKNFLAVGNFNLAEFQTNVRYMYVPEKIPQFKTIYVIIGIVFSLIISYIEIKFKFLFFNIIKNFKNKMNICDKKKNNKEQL